MKNNFKFLLLFIVASFTFAACSNDDDQSDNSITEPAADYTIMMYGCGGGNLDMQMLNNLEQVSGYGFSSKVRFAAKLKFSQPYQEENAEIYGGTRLYTLTEQGLENERVGSQGFRLDNPQNLADFIIETKKRLPAKQYVLILWNHGKEFTINDQLVNSSYPETDLSSRALIYDDNTGELLSIFEQEEAFKLAGGKLDLLYWDVCLMHTIENICQIKDYTRYVMGAGHLTTGLGGNYTDLVKTLEENSDIKDAIKEYIPATVNHWISVDGVTVGKGQDLTLSDMSYIDQVTQVMKDCIDVLLVCRDGLTPGSQNELAFQYLNGTTQNDSKYYSAGGVLYYYDPESSSVDLFSAMTRIANRSLDGEFSARITKLKYAIDKMIPISHCVGTPNFINRVSLGINWNDKAEFQESYPEYPIKTLEELYTNLRFDQATGWSRFLKTNVRKNVVIYTNPITGEESFTENK